MSTPTGSGPPKHLSGAAKRKLSKERAERLSKQSKISCFLSTSSASSFKDDEAHGAGTSMASGIPDGVATGEDDFIRRESGRQVSDDKPGDNGKIIQNATTVNSNEVCEIGGSEEDTKVSDSNVHYESLASIKFPTDKVRFSEPLSSQDKWFIISNGPCQPSGPFPRDSGQKGRCFSESYYTKVNRAGVKLRRAWLCYSPTSDYVYCQACWLFSTRDRESAWVNGTRDWGHLSAKIDLHETSNAHIQCCMILQQWHLRKTLTKDVEDAIREEANFWRQVLDRIINVTLTLALSNLPFRGHREHETSSENTGNFHSIVTLIAKYDPVLDKLLNMPQGTVKYLSPDVQNELIGILSKCVRDGIINDASKAPFFALIMYMTQDTGKRDQLSQVVRYVSIETDRNGKPTEVKINESFLSFVEVEDQSAAGMTHTILNSIENNGLDISKLRGYDEAACISGMYRGVQARITAQQPKATYVHCTFHDLKLVLDDAMSDVPEVRNFFGVVENLYAFFAHNTKRWHTLSSSASESNITLKRLCPTKWSSRYDCLEALRYHFTDILKVLSKIILLSKKKDEILEATALKSQMEQFQFVFLVVLLTEIFESISCLSNLLESPEGDLSKAVSLLQTCYVNLQEARSRYDTLCKSTIEMAKTWGISQEFEEQHVPRVKKFVDELCEDQRLMSAEERFRVNVFFAILDRVSSQIKQRFRGLHEVVCTFNALQPSTLTSATDNDLYAAGEILINQYDTDLSPSLSGQLLSFRACLKSEISKRSTIKEVAALLMVENQSLSSSFPDICTACLLFLTIPVTVATSECSFSKVKIIKSYLRSSMSEERLGGLALLSIENERARKLNISKITDVFAELKARERLLQ
uniref:TTF-type domain-containing protein n=1 Tax=Sphenodon punctatus TaxID=8508 RepID=A0A8D0GJ48_SPHPU